MSAPALRGGSLALLAAALFGLSTPLLQHFGRGLGAFTTAALLYAGAALVSLVMRHPPARGASLRRADLPRIVAMAGFGAVIGPVALAWGLQRTSGSSASLTLTLEALFTAVLAWRLYGEIGATGYGLSLRLYLLAQREFGAGRTGSVFAFAPFIGALGAFAFGSRSGTWMLGAGGVLMLVGVVLHLFESHGHQHDHEELEHEHAHTHEDGHHLHRHDVVPLGHHSHWHRHEPMRHEHPHVPDAHHLHSH